MIPRRPNPSFSLSGTSTPTSFVSRVCSGSSLRLKNVSVLTCALIGVVLLFLVDFPSSSFSSASNDVVYPSLSATIPAMWRPPGGPLVVRGGPGASTLDGALNDALSRRLASNSLPATAPWGAMNHSAVIALGPECQWAKGTLAAYHALDEAAKNDPQALAKLAAAELALSSPPSSSSPSSTSEAAAASKCPTLLILISPEPDDVIEPLQREYVRLHYGAQQEMIRATYASASMAAFVVFEDELPPCKGVTTAPNGGATNNLSGRLLCGLTAVANKAFDWAIRVRRPSSIVNVHQVVTTFGQRFADPNQVTWGGLVLRYAHLCVGLP